MNEQFNNNQNTNNGINNLNINPVPVVPDNSFINSNQTIQNVNNQVNSNFTDNNFANNPQFMDNNFGLGNQNIPQIMPEINTMANNNTTLVDTTPTLQNTLENNEQVAQENNVQPQLYDTTHTINDKVVAKTTTKKGINIDPGLKTAMLLALILLIIIFIIPKIFSLFL